MPPTSNAADDDRHVYYTSPPPRSLKVVLIGDGGAGKTSLRQRYLSGRFLPSYRATIGADFVTRTVRVHDVRSRLAAQASSRHALRKAHRSGGAAAGGEVPGGSDKDNKRSNGAARKARRRTSTADERVTLSIWDTAGQERFRSLGSAFYRGADAVVIAYDVADSASLRRTQQWFLDFCRHTGLEAGLPRGKPAASSHSKARRGAFPPVGGGGAGAAAAAAAGADAVPATTTLTTDERVQEEIRRFCWVAVGCKADLLADDELSGTTSVQVRRQRLRDARRFFDRLVPRTETPRRDVDGDDGGHDDDDEEGVDGEAEGEPGGARVGERGGYVLDADVPAKPDDVLSRPDAHTTTSGSQRRPPVWGSALRAGANGRRPPEAGHAPGEAAKPGEASRQAALDQASSVPLPGEPSRGPTTTTTPRSRGGQKHAAVVTASASAQASGRAAVGKRRSLLTLDVYNSPARNAGEGEELDLTDDHPVATSGDDGRGAAWPSQDGKEGRMQDERDLVEFPRDEGGHASSSSSTLPLPTRRGGGGGGGSRVHKKRSSRSSFTSSVYRLSLHSPAGSSTDLARQSGVGGHGDSVARGPVSASPTTPTPSRGDRGAATAPAGTESSATTSGSAAAAAATASSGSLASSHGGFRGRFDSTMSSVSIGGNSIYHTPRTSTLLGSSAQSHASEATFRLPDAAQAPPSSSSASASSSSSSLPRRSSVQSASPAGARAAAAATEVARAKTPTDLMLEDAFQPGARMRTAATEENGAKVGPSSTAHRSSAVSAETARAAAGAAEGAENGGEGGEEEGGEAGNEALDLEAKLRWIEAARDWDVRRNGDDDDDDDENEVEAGDAVNQEGRAGDAETDLRGSEGPRAAEADRLAQAEASGGAELQDGEEGDGSKGDTEPRGRRPRAEEAQVLPSGVIMRDRALWEGKEAPPGLARRLMNALWQQEQDEREEGPGQERSESAGRARREASQGRGAARDGATSRERKGRRDTERVEGGTASVGASGAEVARVARASTRRQGEDAAWRDSLVTASPSSCASTVRHAPAGVGGGRARASSRDSCRSGGSTSGRTSSPHAVSDAEQEEEEYFEDVEGGDGEWRWVWDEGSGGSRSSARRTKDAGSGAAAETAATAIDAKNKDARRIRANGGASSSTSLSPAQPPPEVQCGFSVFLTSAKEGEGVQGVFDHVVRRVHQRWRREAWEDQEAKRLGLVVGRGGGAKTTAAKNTNGAPRPNLATRSSSSSTTNAAGLATSASWLPQPGEEQVRRGLQIASGRATTSSGVLASCCGY